MRSALLANKASVVHEVCVAFFVLSQKQLTLPVFLDICVVFCVFRLVGTNFGVVANKLRRKFALAFELFCGKALVLSCKRGAMRFFVLPHLQINFNLPLTLSMVYAIINYIPMRCKMCGSLAAVCVREPFATGVISWR